jgi:photosystem II stability/assembly factor-like uncharacterized protein
MRYKRSLRLGCLSAALLAFGAAMAQGDLEFGGPDEAGVPVKPRPAETAPNAARSLLLDVQEVGDRFVAVGDRGHIVASLDGVTWAQVPVPVRAPLTGVHFVDDTHGWAVGHDAVILHSSDGGRTWALQNFEPELESPFLDVYFLDRQRGFVTGAYGLFYVTGDGGESWSEMDAPAVRDEEVHVNSIIRLGNGSLFIVGEMGLMALSTDEGQTWEALDSPYDASLFGAVAMGARGAIIHGMRGNVFVTDDVASGEWDSIETGTVASLFGGTRLPDGRYALVGLGGAVVVVGAAGAQLLATPSARNLSATIPYNNGLLLVGEAGAERLSLP